MNSKITPPWENSRSAFRWPIAGARHIAVAPQKVWDIISMPGNLELCHPFCEKNPVSVWPGSQSRDKVCYLSGWVFERRFRRWFDGVGYDLEIGRQGGRSSFVSWRIAPGDSQNCTLSITVYPHPLQNIPVVIRWLPHLVYLRPMLKRYLSSVVRGVEWYVIRGEPVPRNHFGSHPWFSLPSASYGPS